MNVDLVADYLIAKGDKPNGEALTQLGLQKLVYLCQGWHLAVADEVLFREDICAYELGPVVKELRQRFRFLGSDPLPPTPITDAGRILSPSARKVIDGVWDRYASWPTSRLVDLTHEDGSPWSRVWQRGASRIRQDLVIPVPLIRDWFKASLAEALTPRPTRPRPMAAAFDAIPAGA